MAAGMLRKVIHGGSGKRQREKTEKNVLDFSASTNPFPPDIKWNCDPFLLENYPDDNYTLLKELIADTFHRKPEEIGVGNGSIELIRVCCNVVLSKNGTYFTENPTFGEYAFSAELAGGKPVYRMRDADLLFICNPNNPTGFLRSLDEMRIILDERQKDGGVLCADEAFIELSDPSQSLIADRSDYLIVLRSLTKCFSVPGIRFGYCIGNPDLIEKIEATRLPWTVNAYAEAFALEAFRYYDELAESRRLIAQERSFLSASLSALGLYCEPSSVNFILVKTGSDVRTLCEKLEKRNILVRDCTSFGLPKSIRVAIRTRDENQCLLEALQSCLR
ncbi:MAG: Aspartate aminotransferase [Methanoregula sp. PtaU1.Bin051]|nr:MAG: Aspartate aminotransferase [Methanoregula sp. PtaU1.Bin051]